MAAKHEVLTTQEPSGEEHGEDAQNRLKDALHEDTTVLPDLALLQKNQKGVDPETGLP